MSNLKRALEAETEIKRLQRAIKRLEAELAEERERCATIAKDTQTAFCKHRRGAINRGDDASHDRAVIEGAVAESIYDAIISGESSKF
jgi:predicted  nucleic acid-binding Zn-ribbon protein